jgi:hypothetical protein
MLDKKLEFLWKQSGGGDTSKGGKKRKFMQRMREKLESGVYEGISGGFSEWIQRLNEKEIELLVEPKEKEHAKKTQSRGRISPHSSLKMDKVGSKSPEKVEQERLIIENTQMFKEKFPDRKGVDYARFHELMMEEERALKLKQDKERLQVITEEILK